MFQILPSGLHGNETAGTAVQRTVRDWPFVACSQKQNTKVLAARQAQLINMRPGNLRNSMEEKQKKLCGH
ncbi:hypothetical protein TNCV_3954181 [Trichonephila clavipes]|nr:hypothetical protein TNCV_3954181 [Trichonephila clavipes]